MSIEDDRLRELGLVTPQLAQAKAIDNLSMPKGKANRTLTVLNIKDVPRLNILLGIFDLTGWKWVENVANNEFDLRCSVKRKGMRGRDDVVNVCQPKEESKGVLESFKENITSFFRSGQ
jgi:hypothetical protein